MKTEKQIERKIRELDSVVQEQGKLHPADQNQYKIGEAIDSISALRWVLDDRSEWN